MKAALAKRPDANPFDESIFRSIRAFYADGLRRIDPRLDGSFGTQVIRLCEAITTAAGVGPPSFDSISVPLPKAAKRPSVLVVGGTGFIGRRLVARLVDLGYGVRVLTRSARSAAFDLGNLPVELVAGSHGDPDCMNRALEGITTVYHLTKCAGKRWQDYVVGDIEPTRVLAEAAMAAGVRHPRSTPEPLPHMHLIVRARQSTTIRRSIRQLPDEVSMRARRQLAKVSCCRCTAARDCRS